MREISKITLGFTESVIREMTRICNEYNGCNLAQGFPDFDPPSEIMEAAISAIKCGYNQYAVTFGEPHFRQAISAKVLEYNKIKCDPVTDITVTCGATEAMIATLKAIINPGDEIIIFEPFYENYGPDCILSGAVPKYVTLNGPKWDYDPDELSSAFNNKTKAIIINTPHNPTGKVFERSELKFIADLCMKWDAYAVTDEVYEHILYDGFKHVSIASFDGMEDRTITINSMSKSYSVTGWRVGWAIAQRDITSAIRKVHDFLTVGAARPFHEAGVAAMGMPQSYYDELTQVYANARESIYEDLVSAGFKGEKPQGAYYIMCENDQLMGALGAKDDHEFAGGLIRAAGIASVPGSSFYSSADKGINQLRFCFSKSGATLEKARECFRKIARM
ncbi:MAG: aminotransferase class I/II-fold pyridoxal phosphate-dependent enzyme [Syntrophaceae bacterium]|nr:aminotransferase class I/II-fold pyridoxal phosphate-dependent enzyme [Syntrophaceae bacterium]